MVDMIIVQFFLLLFSAIIYFLDIFFRDDDMTDGTGVSK